MNIFLLSLREAVMKKSIIIFILAAMIFAVSQVLAEPIEVLNYSFEYVDGELVKTKTMGVTPDYWEWGVNGWEAGIEAPSSDGLVCAAIGSEDSLYQLLDHVIMGGDEYTLTFDAYYLWSDTPTYDCTFQGQLYYDDDGQRVVLDYVEDHFDVYDQIWHEYNVITTIAQDSPAIGRQLGIELATVEQANTSWFGFDYVRLKGEYGSIASYINPENKEINVLPNTILEWSPPTLYTPLYYDLYFGSDTNELSPDYYAKEPKFEKENLTTWAPPDELEYETTYYWRVDAYEPNDVGGIVHVGRVWEFTTVTASPLILTEPQSQTVPAGSSAVFTIEAMNAGEYAWRKASHPVTLSTTDTLTIEDVQLEDEDYYYCEITNSFGTAVSAQARLMTERLAGWWKLNDDLQDSIEDVVPGAPAHDGDGDGAFVSGVDESGLEFLADGNIIVIPDTGDYFNFHPQGMTASVWIKSSTATLDGVISKHFASDPMTGWVIGVYNDWCYFALRESHEDLWASDDYGDMFDDDWHLITAVMDPVTQTSRLYVDGAVRYESETYDFAAIVTNDEPVVFGAEDQTGAVPYTGQIDDVRIWTYPLDTMGIVDLYLEFKTEEIVCVIPSDEPWRHFDVVGEPGESSWCRVDIDDFAEFASAWLNCGLVPTCLP
jgi:hypothetical protein